MVGLKLLAEAQRAGLTVHTAGDRLVIRGPRSADAVARLLLEHKAAVLAAIELSEKRPEYSKNSPEPMGLGNLQNIQGAPAGLSVIVAPATAPVARKSAAPARADDDRNNWPSDLVAWVNHLTAADLPKQFQLCPGVEVIDREKFLAWISADIARGPTGPRGASGALVSDLRHLRAVLQEVDT